MTPNLPDLGMYQQFFEFWQRIEPRSRSDNITRSLQAQVRDPAWMLTRQWQFGEFKAEDAGSPIKTSLMTTATRITRLKYAGMETPYQEINHKVPLEAYVERESIFHENNPPNWRFRIQAGQQFARELKKIMNQEMAEDILKSLRKSDVAGIDPSILDHNSVESDSREFLLPITGSLLNSDDRRSLDGYELLSKTEEEIRTVLEDSDQFNNVKTAIENLKFWCEELYSQPFETNITPWQSKRMEYEFFVSSPEKNKKQTVLVAREYDGNELDWFDFSVHHKKNYQLGEARELIDIEENLPSSTEEPIDSIPTNLTFYGNPNHRWWRFEDAQTDFGALNLNKVDLGKLLMMEFVIIHSNDWFVIPYEAKIGSLCRINSLIVTDVFGGTTNVKPAKMIERGIGWNVWDIFSLSKESAKSMREVNPCSSLSTADFLFIPPTLGRRYESIPIEEVRFLRDEMANLVWGIESTIRNCLGEPISGYEAYQDQLRRMKKHSYKDAATNLHRLAIDLEDSTIQALITIIDGIAFEAGITEITDAIANNVKLTEIIEIAKGLVTDDNDDINSIIESIIKTAEKSQLAEVLRLTENAAEYLVKTLKALTPEALISHTNDAIKILQGIKSLDNEPIDVSQKVDYILNKVDEYAHDLGLPKREEDKGPLLSYRFASIIPENWIPYIAVRREVGKRSILLERANMIRNDLTLSPDPLLPKTLLLNSSPKVNEETVSRAGLKVRLNYQRTRWINGSTYLWMGRSVGPGRGEGSSGLRFDYLVHRNKRV